LDEEINHLKKQLGDKYANTKYDAAKRHLATQITGEVAAYKDFLTTQLYDDIVEINSKSKL
jgi:malate synthase